MSKEMIANVLNVLFDSLQKDDLELYEEIMKTAKINKNVNDDHTEFYFRLTYNWDRFLDTYVKMNIGQSEDLSFIYQNSEFIERHFNRLIISAEGLDCSSDKSRTIIRRLIIFYKSNKKIEFDSNAEYTYHHPKRIFTTHDDIISFYESIREMYYGNPDNFTIQLSNIYKKIKGGLKELEISN